MNVNARPRRDIQARYCLGGRHALCPAFTVQSRRGSPRLPGQDRENATRQYIVPKPAILAAIVLLLVLSSLIWYSWRRPLASSSGVASAMVTLAPQTPMALALTPASMTNEAAADQVTPSPTPPATATPSPPIPTVTATVAVPEATITVEATTEISFVALGVPSKAELYLPTPTRSPQEQDDEELWELLPKRPPRLAATRPPDRIVADSIGLDAPVVPVGQKIVDVDGQATAVWEVAEYAAGWHKGSALPGQAGNIVLSGHHNIKGEVFRHLEHLRPGDTVVLYADGRPFWYMVQLKMIVKEKGEPLAVREENARWIGPFPDERLTLVACWPYTSNTHRVIVVARPADVLLPLERPIPPTGRQPLLDFANQGP